MADPTMDRDWLGGGQPGPVPVELRRRLDLILAAEATAVLDLRQRLHQIPEPGLAEHETAATVAAALERLGLPVRRGVGGTGVVSLITASGVGPLAGHGADAGAVSGGPTVGLRADMDALPLTEATGVPYASRRPGWMHACGHDVHMAAVYGAAAALTGLARDGELPGNVKLIFQPAEEIHGGAKNLLAAGVLEEPHVDALFGLHVWPEAPAGKVGYQPGPTMAALDAFKISLTGCTAHAATPHMGRDALVAAAQLVLELQTLVSREIDPLTPALVGLARLAAGEAENVIAGHAELSGTVRTLDPKVRDLIEARLKERVAALALSSGVTGEVAYDRGYPVLANDPALTQLAVAAIGAALGPDVPYLLPRPSLASEDFACYAQVVPCCYLKPGAGGEQPLHHPAFLPPDETVLLGAAALAHAALAALFALAAQTI